MNKKPKKILHLVEAFGGGVYFFLKDLVNRPEMREFQIEIIFGDRGNINEDKIKEDFPSAKLTYWPNAQRAIHPYHDLRAFITLYRMIRLSNPDLIHCHSSKAGVLGRITALFAGKRKRVIYSPHGLSFLKLDDPKWKRTFYQYIEKVCAGLAGIVVGCSASEGKALAEHGISAKIIQNGVSFCSSPLNKKLIAPFTVITVGRIDVQKNPHLFNDIASSMPDVKFLWVGDGSLRHCLTAKNIQVTGWLSREEVSERFQDAHIYLSTSLWEGLPLSVLEAMANGLPLVLKNCVGNLDLVNADNGYLFQKKDEAIARLREIISNPKRIETMGIASQRILKENFSVEEMAAKYRDLYLELLVA